MNLHCLAMRYFRPKARSTSTAPEPAQQPSGAPEPTARTWHALLRGIWVILGWLLALGLSAVIAAGVGLILAYPNLPELNAITDYQPKLPMRIFSHDGHLIGEYGDERRTYLPIHQIPKVMRDAVLAIEDARFYQHGGVDYIGVIRAGLAQFGAAGSQGASTITMQVARNFYLSTEKTLTRKLYEVLLALKIEHYLSKDQILEIYMNQIFLGQRAYGFAAASEIYFGKPLKDISVAEAAMLAGLPKAPSAYNPLSNRKRATARQRYIIDRMLENGFITAQQHQTALEQVLLYHHPDEVPVHADYIAEAARQLVFTQYGAQAYTRGLQVHLTVSIDDQIAAYRALRKGLMDYERRQAYRGPEGTLELPPQSPPSEAVLAEALNNFPDNDDLKAAVVLDAAPRKVTVQLLQSGDTVTLTGEGLRQAAAGLSEREDPKIRIRRGAVVRLLKPNPVKEEWVLTQRPEVEGAFVAMDPLTGEIRAMVGGFDFTKNKFNRVLQAWRQPGSSFKPFIYSAALENGFTPSSVVDDAPLFFDASVTGSQPWEPKNYDGTFEGPMTLRRALAKSKNMVSIRILQSIGVETARKWITHFGFDREKHAPYLTMALGAGSVTPMQMAVAYSVFANKGFLVDPVLIERITDMRGKILHEARIRLPEESMRTISARNAFVMNSLLQEVTRSGTAAKAQAQLKRPDVYGKTGTTNDAMDAWFAGYHPTLTTVVWVGHDTPRKLGSRETGGGLALPIWIDFMQYALRNTPVQELTPPEGVVRRNDEWFFDDSPALATPNVESGAVVAPAATSASGATKGEKRSLMELFH
jgi:penicillin-binding protein 1A